MQFLHPVFTITILILIAYSFLEVYSVEIKNYRSVWLVVVLFIIFSGLRKSVGADYPVYEQMYSYFPLNVNLSEIFDAALFRANDLDVEWLYILINNIFFILGSPFFGFTLFISILVLTIKFHVIEKNVAYPALALLLYIIPTYFISDSGQMRQAIAMALAVYSFKFIKERKLFFFLITIYIAMGFHKSTVIFIPAYWLATIPMNKTRIILIVLASIALSPLQVFNYLSFLGTIAPNEVYEGYSAYVDMEVEQDGAAFKFYDFISLLYLFFIVSFETETSQKIPYYEYMRNLGLVGICLFFIMRGSPIFSTRLPAVYMFFAVMILPNNLASIENLNYKKFLHFVLVIFVVFYYFVFAQYQGEKLRFLPNGYQNFLWN